MNLHRDLDITQKSAWHLVHRIRETWKDNRGDFLGPVGADETFMDGKEKKISMRTSVVILENLLGKLFMRA